MVKNQLVDLQPIPQEQVPAMRAIDLSKEGQKREIIYSPPPIPGTNSAIEVYLQIGSLGNLRLRVLTRLFAQIFKEPFFDQLRTKKQLGYIVRHMAYKVGTSTGLTFIVQSTHDPIDLELHIEEFLGMTEEIIQRMTDDEFKGHLIALSNILLTRPKCMHDEIVNYWQQIVNQQYDFERNQTDAAQLQTLIKADMVEFVRQYIQSNRRKLVIRLWSQSHAEKRTAVEAHPTKNTLLFTDPTELVKHVGI